MFKRVEELASIIEKELPDDFSKTVLKGAILVLKDDQNPLRLNLFSSSLRELISHVLDTLAPTTEIEQCSWYVIEAGTSKPTRRQRAIYATQGGLSFKFVGGTLCLNPEELHDRVIEAINDLNKHTHVRPTTITSDQDEIEKFSTETLKALAGFFDTIHRCRQDVCEAICDHVYSVVTDYLVSETLEPIYEIATHYWIDGYSVEDIAVEAVDHHTIWYKIEGSITVGLQWGSDSDYRNDMGARGEESFPFTCELSAPVATPEKFFESTSERGRIHVDNSEWFKGYFE